MVMISRITLCAMLALTAAGLRAEDWPQFRGPTGQGHSAEHGLPLEWSESRNVAWKTPGPGRGGPRGACPGGRSPRSKNRLEDATSLRVTARQRRIAGAVRRSPDREL